MIRSQVGLTRRTFVGGALGTATALVGRDRSVARGDDVEDEVEAVLARLALDDKVAQLFVFGAEGTGMTPAYADRLGAERPGGVILLGHNIGTPDDVVAFVAAIRATNPDLPPLLTVDQEGGLVARLAGDPAPGAPELGMLPDGEVRALSRARAEFVAGYGFDVNFAPVADVAFAPDSSMAGRCFGADPALVAAKAAAVVEGAAGTGVWHAAKHYPGHGRTPLDSHEVLPAVDLAIESWRESDGLPFAAAVEAGVPLVMLGHLLYRRWDDAPTSLSAVAARVLRGDLGFDGVVVTDDLGMAALAAYDPFDVLDRAVAAGVDLLLYATHPVPPADLIAHLRARVEEGAVPEARLDESLRRVLRLKLGR